MRRQDDATRQRREKRRAELRQMLIESRRDQARLEEESRRDRAEREAWYQALSRPQRVVWQVGEYLVVVAVVLVPLILGAGLILTAMTMQRLSGEDMADAEREGQATVSSCVRHGPITGKGFGYWETCTATITWAGGGAERLTVEAFFTSADIGRAVRVGDVADTPDDRKLARADVAARPWLTWVSYVPLTIGATILLLLTLVLAVIGWLFLTRNSEAPRVSPDEWPFVPREEQAAQPAADETVQDREPVARPAPSPVVEVRRAPPPFTVKIGILLYAALWAVVAGAWLESPFPPPSKDIGYAAFWTLALAAALVAVWRGRPTAVHAMAQLGMNVGVILTVGTLALMFIDLPGVEIEPLTLLPAVAGGSALFAAGWLLRGPAIRQWLAEKQRRADR